MSNRKTRLELTWLGKDERHRLEPRILLEEPELSYQGEAVDNRLIHGDNLLALKALEQEFTGRVKCVFIDPPYNTGSAFEHYDDGLEHSLWLSLIRERLEILHQLLAEDGSLWITIDDNECHYLKVVCDEVFGRANFKADIAWEKVYSERMDATGFSMSNDHILVYGKSDRFQVKPLAIEQNAAQFGYYDEAVGRYYRRRSLRKEGSESLRADRPTMWYPITTPDGSEVWPVKPDGTEGRWRWKQENVVPQSDQLDFVKKSGKWEIYVKQYLEAQATRPPNTLWRSDEVGHNHEAKLEAKALVPEDVFGTPKPERLLMRVVALATDPGDIVLDSFAGSGTTGAVAHKMGRRWIMVELGNQARTHIVPRLLKVAGGLDPGGVTEACGWQGGGGFKFYRLAPSLLERDQWGNWVVNKKYNAVMLAEAMCKIEGFRYEPAPDTFWLHGRSTESDYIYVTTQNLSREQLTFISDQVGKERTLLICCGAFRGDPKDFPNLTLKKIPQTVLSKCEWGRDDYSLNVQEMPAVQAASDATPSEAGSTPKRKRKPAAVQELSLFPVRPAGGDS